jgi:hypothetical protein
LAKKAQLNLDRRSNNKNSQNNRTGSTVKDALDLYKKVKTTVNAPTNSVVRKNTPANTAANKTVKPKKVVTTPKKKVTTPKKVVTPKKADTTKTTDTTKKSTTPATPTYAQNLYNTTIGAKDPGFSAEAKTQKTEWDAQQNLLAQNILDAQKLSDQQYAQQNEQGRQAIEQNQFQQYLQARQAMANRGLSGSGLAEDANARVAMAGQANLSDMLTKNNADQAKIDQAYQAQVNTIYQNRDQMTQSDFEQKLRDAWTQKQQTAFDNGMKLAPYYQMTADQQASSALGYTNALGYMIDPATGQPVYSGGQLVNTLGRDKLTADVANNQASLQARYANTQANIDIAAAKLTSSNADRSIKYKLDAAKSQLGSITKQMNAYTSRNLKVPSTLIDAYNAITTTINDITDSI